MWWSYVFCDLFLPRRSSSSCTKIQMWYSVFAARYWSSRRCLRWTIGRSYWLFRPALCRQPIRGLDAAAALFDFTRTLASRTRELRGKTLQVLGVYLQLQFVILVTMKMSDKCSTFWREKSTVSRHILQLTPHVSWFWSFTCDEPCSSSGGNTAVLCGAACVALCGLLF